MNNEVTLHHAASDCANCGATVSGHFCHECGQETVLHPPSAREFMHEFIGHYVALEGKLWKSLGLLLFRPGRLSLEYIKGRRVRYVQPLRMYLTFSLIFFAIMKFAGQSTHVNVETPPHAPAAQQQSKAPKVKAPQDSDKEAPVFREDHPGEFSEGTRQVRDWLRERSPYLGGRADHFAAMDQAEREKAVVSTFYAYAPYAIFFMMPLFALYLKMLYLGTGRRYGEHLLFALHSNGFAFLVMTLMIVAGNGLVEFVLWLWLVFYLPAAMRRVYGGSRTMTALRWIVLMCLHLISIGSALLTVLLYGVFH